LQRGKRSIKAHRVSRDLKRNRPGVQNGELPRNALAKPLRKIAGEYLVPFCLTPLPPLALGKRESKRLGLKANETPVLLDHAPALQVSKGGT
jgi:hypothetical protein